MQKLKAIITGSKVHDVGYRVLLVNKALSFGVNNFNTFNTYLNGTQAVIAIIEADDETIEEFKNFITNFTPKEAIVENISFEEYKNTVPPIERVMQAFQMEQWGKGIPILLQMLDKQDVTIQILRNVSGDLSSVKEDTSDMKATLSRMETKQDSMLEKQDLMLEKQDTEISLLQAVNGDTSAMNSTLSRMEIDVKDTRFSLSSFIEEKLLIHKASRDIK